MQESNKKVIGNAISAYFLVGISIFFIFSSKPEINHSFVKSHVRSAFILHVLMFLTLFLMSYNFLSGIDVFGYSLNLIITTSILLFLFSGILYGMHAAHNGKTITVGEIFKKSGVKKNLIDIKSGDTISDSLAHTLILGSIPIIGISIYSKNSKVPHLRDVIVGNIFITFLAVLLYIGGYSSLASILMLLYIIWIVFSGIRLISQGEISTINTSHIPLFSEFYLETKAFFSYLKNGKKISHGKVLDTYRESYRKNTLKLHNKNSLRTAAFFSEKCIYIPIINLIGIFALKSKYRLHIVYGICISLTLGLIAFLDGPDSRYMLLLLFPLCTGIGNLHNYGYQMPILYDVLHFVYVVLGKMKGIFFRAKKLKNTTKQETIKIGNTPAEKNES